MSKDKVGVTSSTASTIPKLEHEECKGSVDGSAEPEITQEEDIPSDGPDPEAEAEMKYVLPHPELSTPAENARK